MDPLAKAAALIEDGRAVLASHKPNPPGFIGFPTVGEGFAGWRSKSLSFLRSILSPDSPYISQFENDAAQPYVSSTKAGISILEAVKSDLEAGQPAFVQSAPPLDSVLSLCERFHLAARQLRARRDGRQTLDVADEYDVQDLLHALLHLHFDDIRPEEWTPSYAGSAARMDFLLKPERMVVETKKTRSGLGAKELGNQLIEDIARYRQHPDCGTLVCFVYDPEGRIANPRGIEADLSRTEDDLTVRVVIRPA